MDNEIKPQTYEIRIPVYVSAPVITEPRGLNDVTYSNMIALITKRIDEHNVAQKKIVAQRERRPSKKKFPV